MPSSELEYFRARAAEERSLAQKADQQRVARIHLELAEKYEALAREADQHPTLGAGWDDMSPA